MKKALYQQVRLDILKKIEQKVYLEEEKIPSEDELMELYQVSRNTIREATSRLINENILYRKRGIGTFVAKQKYNETLATKRGFKQEMSEVGLKLKTDVCEIELCDIDIFANSIQTFYIKRIRSINGEPLVFSKTYFSTTIDLIANQEAVAESLYEVIAKSDNIISKIEDQIELGFATSEIATGLNLNDNDPVLKKKRVGYNRHGQVIERSTSYYNPRLYKYSVEFKVNKEQDEL